MAVTVVLRGEPVAIDGDVFALLFGNSVVASYAGVRSALDGKPLPFTDFLTLARQAEIPYPLFFAPKGVVDAQVRLKTEKLMAGFTRPSFSMHSRHQVELHDVELIVKDLLRKQDLLSKHDKSLLGNAIVGLLKKSTRPVDYDANLLMDAIDLSRGDLREAKSKDAAVELMIGRLEAKQILVSRSAQHFMPQGMPPHAKFSGMTLKHKKVPFIFLATGDEGEHLEPAGRKLFTLTLLTVLIAGDTFAPVNYNGHTKDEASPREYQLTAEILMPAVEVREMSFPDLVAIKDAAELFRVTPSAVAMQAWRLGRIDKKTFGKHMDALKVEYNARPKSRLSSPKPVNALKKYNGVECSRRMLAMLDRGQVSANDFRRLMFFNKISASEITAFRQAVG